MDEPPPFRVKRPKPPPSPVVVFRPGFAAARGWNVPRIIRRGPQGSLVVISGEIDGNKATCDDHVFF